MGELTDKEFFFCLKLADTTKVEKRLLSMVESLEAEIEKLKADAAQWQKKFEDERDVRLDWIAGSPAEKMKK